MFNSIQINLILFFVTLILFFFYKRQLISECLNLYDYPKTSRKRHQKPVSLVNGFLILVCLNLILLFDIFFFQLSSYKTNIIFIILFTVFFTIGYLDDLKNLKPTVKTFCIFLVLLIIIPLDQSLVLKQLIFKNFFQKTIILNESSLFLTVFFIYIFYNFMNFSDGLNGIAISLSIFFIGVLIFERGIITYLELILLLSLLFCLILNVLNLSFLGNSGISLLSIVISLIYIQDYNINKTLLCDQIFIIFLIPGLDLIRLVIERTFKGQPFYQGDLNHLHHLMTKIFQKRVVFIFYMIITILPYLISNTIEDLKISIFLGIILYTSIFLFLKNYPKKIKI